MQHLSVSSSTLSTQIKVTFHLLFKKKEKKICKYNHLLNIDLIHCNYLYLSINNITNKVEKNTILYFAVGFSIEEMLVTIIKIWILRKSVCFSSI